MHKEPDIKSLVSLLGEGNVLSSPEDLLSYSYDASRGQAMPDLVVLPTCTEDVQKTLRFASENGICVYPRGAGTGMTGGSIPERGGIALVMTSMNRILGIDTANLTARVEPGVILHEFKETVKAKGLFYPPDPASAKFATIGGTVAVNAGGLNSVKYGVTRDYILALEVVSARGEILRFGAKTMKSKTGYDITRLLVGSEGTLAVITEITLKLLPHPQYAETLVLAFPDDAGALKAALKIISAPLVPSTLEFMDDLAVHCAHLYTGDAFLKGAGGLLLIEFDAVRKSAGENVNSEINRAKKIGIREGAIRIRQSADPAEREELWEIRRCISPAIYEVAPNKRNEDICVPRTEIPAMIGEIKRIAKENGIKVVNFAHAGDGNIHVNFMYHESDPVQAAGTHKAVEELFRITIAHGGTLSGEHGIGRTKSAFLSLEVGAAERNIMQQIKAIFDPQAILNPNKIFKEFP